MELTLLERRGTDWTGEGGTMILEGFEGRGEDRDIVNNGVLAVETKGRACGGAIAREAASCCVEQWPLLAGRQVEQSRLALTHAQFLIDVMTFSKLYQLFLNFGPID